jgi:hypothetical protein
VNTHRGTDLGIHVLLTLALEETDKWSASCPGRFIAGPNWTEGDVRPTTGLDAVEQTKPGIKPHFLGRPARSPSLYRLSYPGSISIIYRISISFPVTGRGGPKVCETSRLPRFLESQLTDGGEVVSLTRRPPFTPTKIPGTHSC